MLELKNVDKKFGKLLCIKNINLSFDSPGLYLFHGPNGSGKSTVLKIMSQMIYKSSGDYEVQEVISYLPDKFLLPKLMRVKSYVKSIFRLYRVVDKPLEVLEKYQIPNKRIKELSKGNLQKLGILQIFSIPAKIYILDEPLDGLDDFAKKLFKEAITEVIHRGGIVIMSLHNRGYLNDLHPRVYEMKDGGCYEKKKKI